MSKVAIQGDPSGTGTFTIASPNSNNNRTLTLPDATGTVAVSGSAVTFGALTATTLDVGAGSASTPSLTFTGDTNTGIYSPGADTIGITNNGIEKFRVQTNGFQAVGEDWSSTLKPAYFCRAWVNFNGTGTVAIRASGNVSSITDNNTGDYTVNFAVAMVDANYSVTGVTNESVLANRSQGWCVRGTDASLVTTSSVRIDVGSQSAGTAADLSVVTFSAFR